MPQTAATAFQPPADTGGASSATPGTDAAAAEKSAAASAADAAARVESILAGFDDDPRVRDQAEELVRTLVGFYDIGLARMTALVAARADGAELMRALAADRAVAGLLIVHDLHPETTYERVSAALERVRPYLGSHSGGVDLLGVDDGVVRLRLAGSCDGCPSSAVTVQLAIEQAISEAAPEVTRVDVDGVAPAPAPRGSGGITINGPGGRTLLPVLGSVPPVPGAASKPQPALAPQGSWVPLGTAAGVLPGSLTTTSIGGAQAIVANLGGALYAYHDRCPACGATLGGAELAGDLIGCPRCAERFDVRRAGAGANAGLHLDPIPLLTEDGEVRAAVHARAATAGAAR